MSHEGKPYCVEVDKDQACLSSVSWGSGVLENCPRYVPNIKLAFSSVRVESLSIPLSGGTSVLSWACDLTFHCRYLVLIDGILC